MLTDKTKIEFDKWYNTKYFPIDHNATKGYSTSIINKGSISLSRFAYVPFEMQYGVYIEFFDSVEIHIWTIPSLRVLNKWTHRIFFKEITDVIPNQVAYIFKNRKEAQEQAIKKANEIYNNMKQLPYANPHTCPMCCWQCTCSDQPCSCCEQK